MDILAWISLVLAVIGIGLFIRRLIIWNTKKQEVVQKIGEGTPTILVVNLGKQMGPYTREEAAGMVAAGMFAPDALYWEPGMMEWQPVAALTV